MAGCSYAGFLVRFHWLVLLLVVAVAATCIAVAFTVKDFPNLDDPTKGFESRGTEIKGRYDAITNLYDSSEVSVPNVHNTFRRKRQTSSSSSCYYRSTYDHREFFKLVFTPTSGASLWALPALQEMCSMDTSLIVSSQYVASNGPSHSIGRYVAEYRNKGSCADLTEDDVTETLQVLKNCSSHYYDSYDNGTCEITVPGCDHPALFTILHDLTDSEFLGRTNQQETLTYGAIWFRVDFGKSLDFYLDAIHQADLTGTHVEVVAVDTTDRFDIFSNFLFRDMVFFIVGISLIFVIMGLYLKSFLITMFTLFDVLFSFGVAYFLYMVVFAIPHMPFLGFLSILLLIAVAADDVFILYDSYEQAKIEHPDEDMTFWMSEGLGHAAISILVTSLTTSAALFANIVSDITDIKAFGIISGTSIMVNYVLVVTWVPAAIVTIEKIDNCLLTKIKCCECFEKFVASLRRISVTIFHNVLPTLVSKVWFVWLILFLGLGIGGIVVTFVKPKLELPTSQDFGLFGENSLIEVWFQDLKYKFRFYQKAEEERLGSGMLMLAVWGVDGEDTGSHLDPDSKAKLQFESSFDLSQPESQTWMANFCHEIKNASFFDKSRNLHCGMDIFQTYLKSNCTVMRNLFAGSWTPAFEQCCENNEFPVNSSVFKTCHYYLPLVALRNYNSDDIMGYPFYATGSQELKAYTIQFRSNQGWVANFQVMDKFYKEIQDWIKQRLATAPTGVKQAWMTSRYDEFDLYDLQTSLASGTYAAIGVSMAAAFVVMLVTSLNVIITVYAIFTIFLTISTCAGILVLLGWELNIVESVTLTMSVGLSIDFCIHYGMGYRLSNLSDRKLRVHEAFKKVGAAIFMAAATTFIAGACVMPSIVLFYTQLGTFLMLVMALSWLFATFFFQSLCYVLGPTGNFCQIPSPCEKFCDKGEPQPDPSPSKVSPSHSGTETPEKLGNSGNGYYGNSNKAYDTAFDGHDVDHDVISKSEHDFRDRRQSGNKSLSKSSSKYLSEYEIPRNDCEQETSEQNLSGRVGSGRAHNSVTIRPEVLNQQGSFQNINDNNTGRSYEVSQFGDNWSWRNPSQHI